MLKPLGESPQVIPCPGSMRTTPERGLPGHLFNLVLVTPSGHIAPAQCPNHYPGQRHPVHNFMKQRVELRGLNWGKGENCGARGKCLDGFRGTPRGTRERWDRQIPLGKRSDQDACRRRTGLEPGTCRLTAFHSRASPGSFGARLICTIRRPLRPAVLRTGSSHQISIRSTSSSET